MGSCRCYVRYFIDDIARMATFARKQSALLQSQIKAFMTIIGGLLANPCRFATQSPGASKHHDGSVHLGETDHVYIFSVDRKIDQYQNYKHIKHIHIYDHDFHIVYFFVLTVGQSRFQDVIEVAGKGGAPCL